MAFSYQKGAVFRNWIIELPTHQSHCLGELPAHSVTVSPCHETPPPLHYIHYNNYCTATRPSFESVDAVSC